MVSSHAKPDFTYLNFNVTLLYKDNIITLSDIFFLKPNYTKNKTQQQTQKIIRSIQRFIYVCINI